LIDTYLEVSSIARGAVQTARDREIVDWIGWLGTAGAEHVTARFGMGLSRA
jgi:hypothetical protein